MTIKRISAGDYQCEHKGVKFTVYRIKEYGWRNNALSRPNRHGSYTDSRDAFILWRRGRMLIARFARQRRTIFRFGFVSTTTKVFYFSLPLDNHLTRLF